MNENYSQLILSIENATLTRDNERRCWIISKRQSNGNGEISTVITIFGLETTQALDSFYMSLQRHAHNLVQSARTHVLNEARPEGPMQ